MSLKLLSASFVMSVLWLIPLMGGDCDIDIDIDGLSHLIPDVVYVDPYYYDDSYYDPCCY